MWWNLITYKSQRKNFTPLIKKCYHLYFGCKIGDQNKSWVPYIYCVTCFGLLTGWANGSRHTPSRSSHGMEGAKDHSSTLLFLYNKYHRD